MGFNTTGAFTFPAELTWVNGQFAYADYYNVFLAELRAAISRAQLRAQTIKRTKYLQMNGFLLKNIKKADSAYDALRYDQLFPAMVGNNFFYNTTVQVSDILNAPSFQLQAASPGWLYYASPQGAAGVVVTSIAGFGTFFGPAYLRWKSFANNLPWSLTIGTGGNLYYKGTNRAVSFSTTNPMFIAWKRADGNWHMCPLEPTGASIQTEAADSFITEDGSLLITEN